MNEYFFISKGAVDRALKSKHYKKHCLRLMCEVLMSQQRQRRLTPNLADETRENLEILRDISLSQESHTTAYSSLKDDADLECLITNLFTQGETSDRCTQQNVLAVHICN